MVLSSMSLWVRHALGKWAKQGLSESSTAAAWSRRAVWLDLDQSSASGNFSSQESIPYGDAQKLLGDCMIIYAGRVPRFWLLRASKWPWPCVSSTLDCHSWVIMVTTVTKLMEPGVRNTWLWRHFLLTSLWITLEVLRAYSCLALPSEISHGRFRRLYGEPRIEFQDVDKASVLPVVLSNSHMALLKNQ